MVIFNKMMMTGLLSLIAPGNPVQMVAAVVIMQTFLLVVLKLSPYKLFYDDIAIVASSVSLLLTMLACLVLFMDSNTHYFNSSDIGWGMIVMNCGVLFLQVCILFFVKCGYANKIKQKISKSRSKVIPQKTQDQITINDAAQKAWQCNEESDAPDK